MRRAQLQCWYGQFAQQFFELIAMLRWAYALRQQIRRLRRTHANGRRGLEGLCFSGTTRIVRLTNH